MKAGDKLFVCGLPCTVVEYTTETAHALREASLRVRELVLPNEGEAGARLCALCPAVSTRRRASSCTVQCRGDRPRLENLQVCVIDEALPYLALEGVL